MKNIDTQKVKFAICVTESEPDLELRKIYKILPDEQAAKDDYVRVIDESGEDYLYPASSFIFIEIPVKKERELLLAT